MNATKSIARIGDDSRRLQIENTALKDKVDRLSMELDLAREKLAVFEQGHAEVGRLVCDAANMKPGLFLSFRNMLLAVGTSEDRAKRLARLIMTGDL